MNSTTKNTKFLSFAIANEIFAINISVVQEVIFAQEVSEIPLSASHIKGIINYRGKIVTIYDIRNHLNIHEKKINNTDVFVILKIPYDDTYLNIAIICNRVYEVFDVSETEIEPVQESHKNYNVDILTGMYKLKNQFIMLLNQDQIIDMHSAISINSNERIN